MPLAGVVLVHPVTHNPKLPLNSWQLTSLHRWYAPMLHQFNRCWRLGSCATCIVSGTQYVQCTDASLVTIGSSGASLVASLDLQRRTDLCHTVGRQIFWQPSDAPMLGASVLPVLLISVELFQFSVSLSSFFVFCFACPFYFVPGI